MLGKKKIKNPVRDRNKLGPQTPSWTCGWVFRTTETTGTSGGRYFGLDRQEFFCVG